MSLIRDRNFVHKIPAAENARSASTDDGGIVEKHKTEKPGFRLPKTGFSVLKNLRVTRFFGFGKNRVGNCSGFIMARP